MHGFGSASQQDIAAAKAAMPKCLSFKYQQTCEENKDDVAYPGCAAIWKLRNEDYDSYHDVIEGIPYCPAQDEISLGPISVSTMSLIMAGSGLLAGLLIARLLWIAR